MIEKRTAVWYLLGSYPEWLRYWRGEELAAIGFEDELVGEVFNPDHARNQEEIENGPDA